MPNTPIRTPPTHPLLDGIFSHICLSERFWSIGAGLGPIGRWVLTCMISPRQPPVVRATGNEDEYYDGHDWSLRVGRNLPQSPLFLADERCQSVSWWGFWAHGAVISLIFNGIFGSTCYLKQIGSLKPLLAWWVVSIVGFCSNTDGPVFVRARLSETISHVVLWSDYHWTK